ITGAKAGLWLVGSELSFPSFFASAYTAGSSPPKNQYTAGTSQPAPKQPKSSLAIVGFVCSMESCQALHPAVQAIFVLDGRVWDHQAQDIALETILVETRQNRGWFSAKWQSLLRSLKQTSGPK